MKYNLTALLLLICAGISAQCYPDQHSTTIADGWMSCSTFESPRADLGSTHWIQYDLGSPQLIHSIHLWNANLPSQPGVSIKRLRVDYSMDGEVWSHLSDYDLERPTGGSRYEGNDLSIETAPEARYILLTAMENYGSDCSGIGEVRFGVEALSTSTQEIYSDVEISISPNPATDFLRISLANDFTPDRMAVYDMSGALVVSGRYQNDLSLADWSEGQYVLTLSDDKGSVSRSFTIIKPK